MSSSHTNAEGTEVVSGTVPPCPEMYMLQLFKGGIWRIDIGHYGSDAEAAKQWGLSEVEEGTAAAYRVIHISAQGGNQ